MPGWFFRWEKNESRESGIEYPFFSLFTPMNDLAKDYRVLWTLIGSLLVFSGVATYYLWKERQKALQLSEEKETLTRDNLAWAFHADSLQRYIEYQFPRLDPLHPLVEAGRPGSRFPGAEGRGGGPEMNLGQIAAGIRDSSRGEIRMFNTKDGLRLILTSGLLYARGSEGLTASGAQMLDRLGPVLVRASGNFVVLVQGHSDAGEFPGSQTALNSWDLSYQRAAGVARYLVETLNVPANAVAIEACGEFFPEYNTGPDSRVLNRRVEIWLLSRD